MVLPYGRRKRRELYKTADRLYGYKKQAFYALKEGFRQTICFDKKVDVVYRNNRLFEPIVTGAKKGETYDIEITVKDLNDKIAYEKNITAKATGFTFSLQPFNVELKDGYYYVKYSVESKN